MTHAANDPANDLGNVYFDRAERPLHCRRTAMRFDRWADYARTEGTISTDIVGRALTELGEPAGWALAAPAKLYAPTGDYRPGNTGVKFTYVRKYLGGRTDYVSVAGLDGKAAEIHLGGTPVSWPTLCALMARDDHPLAGFPLLDLRLAAPDVHTVATTTDLAGVPTPIATVARAVAAGSASRLDLLRVMWALRDFMRDAHFIAIHTYLDQQRGVTSETSYRGRWARLVTTISEMLRVELSAPGSAEAHDVNHGPFLTVLSQDAAVCAWTWNPRDPRDSVVRLLVGPGA